jgi:hypothetical protein
MKRFGIGDMRREEKINQFMCLRLGNTARKTKEAEIETALPEETIPMKLTWHGHSAFRIEAGAAKILIDPFLSDNPSWEKGWSGYLTGENSTQGGDR